LLLVAPDSFKGTHSAGAVTAAIARGIERAGERADPCPLADGGEGTMDALLTALGGRRVAARAHDPLGREIDAELGVLADGRAIVETAAASGLGLVGEDDRDAEAASSFGTGELIAAAVRAGATGVLVAVGGSATTDGGAGAIEAIEAAGGLREAALEVLCDVRTPFEDAARVFGPQKGADPAAVVRLAARLDRLAESLARDPRGVAMSGCAGGLSGGLWAAFGARLRPGAAAVMEAVGFDARLAAADAAVSGEGRLDEQSLEGKLVGEVAARCRAAGRPLHLIVGSVADAALAGRLGASSLAVASTLAEIEAAAHALPRGLPGSGSTRR
jgi:glycerate kinase